MGLSVISSSEGVDLGRVSEVIVDLAQGVVVGMIIGSGPDEKGVLADDISVMGPDAVMIPDQSKARELADLPSLVEKRPVSPEATVTVVSGSGTKLGTLAEVYIEPPDNTVVSYEISGGPVRDLTDGTLALSVMKGIVHGPDIVVVPDAAIAELDEQVGGLKGAWAQLSRALKEDYEEASERAGELYQRSVESVRGAVEEAKQRSEQAREALAAKPAEGQAQDEAPAAEPAPEEAKGEETEKAAPKKKTQKKKAKKKKAKTAKTAKKKEADDSGDK